MRGSVLHELEGVPGQQDSLKGDQAGIQRACVAEDHHQRHEELTDEGRVDEVCRVADPHGVQQQAHLKLTRTYLYY